MKSLLLCAVLLAGCASAPTASDALWTLTDPRGDDYGSGYVDVVAGVTGDGQILVGAVHGPYAWFDGAEPYLVFDSMIRLEP